MVSNDPGTPPPSLAAAVSALRQDLRAAVAEAQAVRHEVQRDQKKRRVTTIVGLALAVLILLLIWQNNRIAEDARQTSEQLTDCTVPGGKCFEQSQKRTGAAVSAIGRTQLYIVECSRELGEGSGPAWDVRFEKCVADRLAKPPK